MGAGQNLNENKTESTPVSLIKDQYGKTVLRWVLNSLQKNNIHKIRFVGGYEIQKIGSIFPNLEFIYNAAWNETGVLESLFQARKYINGPVIISYGDIVFSNEVIKKIISDTEKDIVLAYEKKNLVEIYGSQDIVKNVISVENHKLKNIGYFKPNDESSGEFIGTVFFSNDASAELRYFLDKVYPKLLNKPFEQADKIQNAYLTDLLRYFKKNKYHLHCQEIGNEWIEIDNKKSLTKFVIGTKGDTLKKLKGISTKSVFCNQYIFKVNDWTRN